MMMMMMMMMLPGDAVGLTCGVADTAFGPLTLRVVGPTGVSEGEEHA